MPTHVVAADEKSSYGDCVPRSSVFRPWASAIHHRGVVCCDEQHYCDEPQAAFASQCPLAWLCGRPRSHRIVDLDARDPDMR